MKIKVSCYVLHDNNGKYINRFNVLNASLINIQLFHNESDVIYFLNNVWYGYLPYTALYIEKMEGYIQSFDRRIDDKKK